MNQHRWTCLTTLVLTTVLAPIATVEARTSPSPAMRSIIAASKEPRMSQPSLPIITPLTVTELETDVAMPKTSSRLAQNQDQGALPVSPTHRQVQPVPVDRLQPLPAKIATVAPTFDPTLKIVSSGFPRSDTANLFTTNSQPIKSPIPVGTEVPQLATPLVNPALPVSQSIASPQLVGSLAPTITTPQNSQSFSIRSVGNPVLVVRNGSLPTAIVGTIAAQAEFAHLPQSAPSIGHIEDLSDIPTFEAGLPTLIFDSNRPQQIIATAIAQIGSTTAASEPSIAIPVQRSQPNLPTQLPIPAAAEVNPQPPAEQIIATHTGKASWYGLEGGPKTANGENYNPNGLTAAHRTLPFGTKVRVISLKTGKSVVVRINDRGPFRSNRIIDVSAAAAEAIGMKDDGIGSIKMEVLAAKLSGL